MRVEIQSIVIGVVAFAAVASSSVAAQMRRHDLFSAGAPLSEVLAAWGEPEERVVRSVKRELVWNYKGGARVIFKDGRVVSYKVGPRDSQHEAKKAAEAEIAKKAVSASPESKDFLREIVREIPSGAEGPAPIDAPPSNDPNLAGLIPNAVPQRAGQAAIAPGVVVPGLEDDQ